MDKTSLTFDLLEQHNAEYPREVQIARELSRLLKTVSFPDDRIWIDLRFDYSMAEPSASSVDLIRISGEVHGVAIIKFHGLYLHQDFTTMFAEALPHELAHVLHAIQAKETEAEISKPHDETWQELVGQLSPDASPTARIKGLFDDRAVRMLKGGVGVECECGDEDAFAVLPDTPSTAVKLRNEELTCTTCRFPYQRVDAERLPEKVRAELKFLEGVRAVKLHHAQLQR